MPRWLLLHLRTESDVFSREMQTHDPSCCLAPAPAAAGKDERGLAARAAAVAAAEFPAAGFRLAASLGSSAGQEDLQTNTLLSTLTGNLRTQVRRRSILESKDRTIVLLFEY